MGRAITTQFPIATFRALALDACWSLIMQNARFPSLSQKTWVATHIWQKRATPSTTLVGIGRYRLAPQIVAVCEAFRHARELGDSPSLVSCSGIERSLWPAHLFISCVFSHR